MVAQGFDQLNWLDAQSLGADSRWLKLPLANIGIAPGDILCLRSTKGVQHLEVNHG